MTGAGSEQRGPTALPRMPAGDAMAAGWRRARSLSAGERASWWAWSALAVLLLVGAVVCLHETRGTVFADDEWQWILQRRGGAISTYLDPHNSHLSLVPVVIYKILFAIVGARHYWPYRAIVTVAHLAVVGLVFHYARRRVGAWAAWLGAALILFFGPGWQDFLWPFQVAWLIVLVAGLTALLALDRRDLRGDVAACVALGVALASAGPGLAVAAGLIVEVALTRPWRRWWIVAIPVALYALWWLGFEQTNVSHSSIYYITRFAFDAAAGVMSSLAGLSGSNALLNAGDFVSWGAPLLVAGVAALVWRLRARHLVAPRVAGLVIMLIAFWVTTAIGRAYVTLGSAVFTSTGDESRYLYIGAVLVVVLAAEAAAGARPAAIWLALGTVLTAAAVASNIGSLRDGGALLRSDAATTVTALGTLDMTRDIVSPDFTSSAFIFGIVKAGPYFAAERALGSPSASPAQISAEPDGVRQLADAQLIAIHHVTLVPAAAPGAGTTPAVDAVAGGTVTRQDACIVFTPSAFLATGATATVDVTLPAAGLTIEAGGGTATVALRRFATAFSTLGTVPPGQPAQLRIGPDLAAVPWHVRVVPTGDARVCAI